MLIIRQNNVLNKLAVLLTLLILSVNICWAKESAEFGDVFTHESTSVAAGQTVGKLMVTDGNAEIEGTVTDGIIIVDGNLTIKPMAVVKGKILVLGGNVTIEAGAKVEHSPWAVVHQGHPLVPVVVMTLLLLGAASLIVIPMLLWLVGYLFKKTPWYIPVREKILFLENRWPILYIILSLAISGFMLAAFATLAWETLFRDALDVFDNSFIWLIRYFHNAVIDQIMIIISEIGFGTSYIVIVAITFGILMFLKRRREMGALAVCLAGGAALSFLLKNLFHRARPDFFRVVQEVGFSFPSGHALATMCFYGMVAFLIMRTLASWRWRLVVMTLAIILSMAVGISRIYLGVHYPTDVIAGYAAGSMWLAFCISLLMWWEKERTK